MAPHEFKQNIRFVIIRRFVNLTEAKIYQLQLEDQGIRCFLSNTNTSLLLPVFEGGITLHVDDTQYDDAQSIIQQLDADAALPAFDEEYRDADHDDIEFARKVYEREKRLNQPLKFESLLLILIVGVSILLFAILKGFKYF